MYKSGELNKYCGS